MTQEDKKLLLIDLSARVPYGVIVSPIDCGKAKLIGFKNDHPILFDLVSQKEYNKPWDIEYIKPYLRPMSSMTEEEYEQYRKFSYYGAAGYRNNDYKEMVATPSFEKMDFLNAHHFDYRGLIEKGLALEALEGMYD